VREADDAPDGDADGDHDQVQDEHPEDAPTLAAASDEEVV
jgi:hypothetical protein